MRRTWSGAVDDRRLRQGSGCFGGDSCLGGVSVFGWWDSGPWGEMAAGSCAGSMYKSGREVSQEFVHFRRVVLGMTVAGSESPAFRRAVVMWSVRSRRSQASGSDSSSRRSAWRRLSSQMTLLA